jgi:hypothetical protein
MKQNSSERSAVGLHICVIYFESPHMEVWFSNFSFTIREYASVASDMDFNSFFQLCLTHAYYQCTVLTDLCCWK